MKVVGIDGLTNYHRKIKEFLGEKANISNVAIKETGSWSPKVWIDPYNYSDTDSKGTYRFTDGKYYRSGYFLTLSFYAESLIDDPHDENVQLSTLSLPFPEMDTYPVSVVKVMTSPPNTNYQQILFANSAISSIELGDHHFKPNNQYGYIHFYLTCILNQ